MGRRGRGLASGVKCIKTKVSLGTLELDLSVLDGDFESHISRTLKSAAYAAVVCSVNSSGSLTSEDEAIRVGALATAVEQSSAIKTLQLTEFAYAASLDALAPCLGANSSKLAALNLDHCKIGDDGVFRLVALLLENKTLTACDLAHNSISMKGTTALKDMMLHNTSIVALNLAGGNSGHFTASSKNEQRQILNKIERESKWNYVWPQLVQHFNECRMQIVLVMHSYGVPQPLMMEILQLCAQGAHICVGWYPTSVKEYNAMQRTKTLEHMAELRARYDDNAARMQALQQCEPATIASQATSTFLGIGTAIDGFLVRNL